MSLKEKILEDLKQAMLARDEVKTSTLRMVLSAVTNFEKSVGVDHQATDEDVMKIINKQVKMYEESIEVFSKAGRTDLVEKEEKEFAVIKSYLPEQLPEEETRRVVEETINEVGATSISDMGKVMGPLTKKIAGRAPSSLLAQLVKEELGA